MSIIRVVVVSPLVLQNQKKSLRLLPLVSIWTSGTESSGTSSSDTSSAAKTSGFFLVEQLQRRVIQQLRVSHLVIMPAKVVKRKNLRIRRQHLAQVVKFGDGSSNATSTDSSTTSSTGLVWGQ